MEQKIAAGLAIFALLYGSVSTANKQLTSQPSYVVQSLYTFDLVGISVRTGQIYLPDIYNDFKKKPKLIHFWPPHNWEKNASPLTMDNLRLLYDPTTNMNIYFYGDGLGLRFLSTPEEITILRTAWLAAIIKEPMAYLKVRAELFSTMIGLKPYGAAPYYCIGENSADSQHSEMMSLPNFYLEYKDSWLFKPIVYIALIIGCLAIAYRKRYLLQPELIALSSSALLYTAGYALIGVSGDARYLYWVIPVSIIIVLNMAYSELIYRRIQKRERHWC